MTLCVILETKGHSSRTPGHQRKRFSEQLTLFLLAAAIANSPDWNLAATETVLLSRTVRFSLFRV